MTFTSKERQDRQQAVWGWGGVGVGWVGCVWVGGWVGGWVASVSSLRLSLSRASVGVLFPLFSPTANHHDDLKLVLLPWLAVANSRGRSHFLSHCCRHIASVCSSLHCSQHSCMFPCALHFTALNTGTPSESARRTRWVGAHTAGWHCLPPAPQYPLPATTLRSLSIACVPPLRCLSGG